MRVPAQDPVPEHVIARRRQIGRRIRDARIDADLTQEQLAERTDLDRRTIINIEMGHFAARIDSLLMIADAVHVPLSRLVGD